MPTFVTMAQRLFKWSLAPAVVLAALAVPQSAQGAFATSYGNSPGVTVDFLGVNESTATDSFALYGPPTAVGDQLTFAPTAFEADAPLNGPADLTDGRLNFVIDAKVGQIIDLIQVDEAGSYSLLSPAGGDSALVSVSAPVFLTISEVNGAAINPFTVSGNLTFTPGDLFSLTGPAGPSAGNFTGTLSVNVAAAVTGAGYIGDATKVELSMDNSLIAVASGPGGSAHIEKSSLTVTVFPEPVTLPLLGLAGLFLRRRRANG